MLLLPIARALRIRTGKDYLLYLMAICCAGSVTHCVVAPHPGPLAMAETLGIDLGLTIMVGIVAGIVPALSSWAVAKWMNRHVEIPIREVAGAPLADLQEIVAKPESELPSFAWSITPIFLPILLISLASVVTAIQGGGFRPSNVQDPVAFATHLSHTNTVLSSYLWSSFSPAAREELGKLGASGASPVVARRILADELNRIIKSGRLYQAERFQGVPLSTSTRRLLDARSQGDNLVALNRSLIQDSYPECLAKHHSLSPSLCRWVEFIGNRNVALMVGALFAMFILARQRNYSMARICELIGPPFETAGVIILITSAGGAFGLMLKNAGVGEAIRALASGHEINYIFLSYIVASVIRIAQGSATVAMLTTSAMMLPMIGAGAGLPYHPVYLFLSIGFGALTCSWMNDSGFWVISKLSGMTEKETLKSWTLISTVNSLAGLIVTWMGATWLPMKPM
jgi:H+/gluconate symporter-like permease